MTKTYHIEIEIKNRPLGDIIEFWIPCTKELFVITHDKIVFKSKTTAAPSKLASAWTELIFNISLPGKSRGVMNHVLRVPPEFFTSLPVIVGCRRVDIRTQRAKDEIYLTPQQLSSEGVTPGTPRVIMLGKVEIHVKSSELKITKMPVELPPLPGREVGILYEEPVVTDEWLEGTYLDMLCALGRENKRVDDYVDDDDFQELLMVTCSECLTRGEYVEKDDAGLQTFLNGLSPCVMSRDDCAVGIYQVYMSIYFGSFSLPGSLRMQHVAHELGYPMLTADFERIIFRTQRDEKDRVFDIPFRFKPDILPQFEVYPARNLHVGLDEDALAGEKEGVKLYCYARTLLKLEEHPTYSYMYTFPDLVPKHNSSETKLPDQLCFVRPIIPLEYRTKNEDDVHLIHLLNHFPLGRAADRYCGAYPTRFEPRLTPKLKEELERKRFAFVWFFGRGYCVNTPPDDDEEEDGD